MNWKWEDNPRTSIVLGLALAFVWGVVSLAYAYDRTLANVNAVFATGFMAADRLDAVLDDLARLNVDQQAFLSTGDTRFQDGVIENAEALETHTGVLRATAAASGLSQGLLAGLEAAVSQALAAVGQSDQIRQARGSAAARAYFETKESDLAEVRWRVNQLRTELSSHLSRQIREARSGTGVRSLFFGSRPAAPIAEP